MPPNKASPRKRRSRKAWKPSRRSSRKRARRFTRRCEIRKEIGMANKDKEPLEFTTTDAESEDPKSKQARRDQRADYDAMRQRCPVAHSESTGWTLFRHEDVMRVLLDDKTFSNAVSRHLSAPNGMDPPEPVSYTHLRAHETGRNL